MEDIIYKITDKAHSQKRLSVLKYASKIKDELINSLDSKQNEQQDFITNLKNISKTRYRGLNLQNINKPNKNTIEFRMANGEIDFEELLANINLFAKLIQVSHDLNTVDKNNKKLLLAKSLYQIKNEKIKLDCFLKILFDDEKLKEKYYERFISNSLVMEIIEGKTKTNETKITLDNNLKLKRV